MAQAMTDNTQKLAETLSAISVKDWANPFPKMEQWPEAFTPGEDWHMNESLISLQGMPIYDELGEEGKKKLSFYEAVNFYSLNIHGERSLMEGLAKRLYRKWPKPISEYIHHFISEENNHMAMFGGFCMKYFGKVYPDRHMVLEQEYLSGEEDFLFFAKILVFEEIVDYYNYLNAKDESLHPTAREINFLHRKDESRHLAFGRKVVADLYREHAPQWGEAKCKEISGYLKNYIQATLREYVNPDIYRDAGFENPFDIRNQCWEAPSSFERREKSTAKIRRFFETNQMIEV